MESAYIGLLFSLTGTTSTTECGQYHAALYTLEQYNSNKNPNDPSFIYEVRDIRSDPRETYQHALELAKSGIKIFVGCYTSACRKAILPVLEKFGCLLVYPTLYEGQEIHPNVIYIGEVPNQQVSTLLQYTIRNFGKKIFLIGNDYIYPRYTHQQIRQLLLDYQGIVVDEQFFPLGHSQFIPLLKSMEKSRPDAIISTLVGESILHFYRAYCDLGLIPKNLPILSPITTELEIKAMGPLYAAGHYSCTHYFQSIENAENNEFVLGLKAMYGQDTVVSSVMSNTYTGVSMILEAVSRLETTEYRRILKYLYGKTFSSPSGAVQVNRNHHLTREIRIGQANLEGQFTILWSSDQPISPKPLLNDAIESKEEDGEDWKSIVELWGQLSGEAVVILDEHNQILYISPDAFSLLHMKAGEKLQAGYLQELAQQHPIKEHRLDSGQAYRFLQITSGKLSAPTHQNIDQEIKFDRICTRNMSFKKELSVVQVAAQHDANVLILGETGTGKEVMARAIHNQSTRRQGPFIAVNTGAIPRELIASELFGYVEGAFTGSRKGGSMGKFEAAHGGTLFLDEIGEMPMELQVSLLRVLEERKVIRIGEHKERPVDVRIIAATNCNIKEEIAFRGSFRSDLYYRLNVFTIQIPPLRERMEDIEHLSVQFLLQFQQQYAKGPAVLSSSVLHHLQNYSWPGNIRELKNVMERAFLLALNESEILTSHLPAEFQVSVSASSTHGKSLKSLEKQVIEQTLREAPSLSEAARKLGVTRSTLYRKIGKWNIQI